MGDALWSPLYDLHATSEDGKPSTSLSLHYRVNLQQETGEDWKDAKLILSTSATDALDAGVPVSDSLTVQPKESPPPAPMKTAMASTVLKKYKIKARSAIYEDSDSPSIAPSIIDPPPAPLPAMAQTAAIVSKNPMAVSYIVDEHTTIPSDPLSYKVLVAIIPFEATISHLTSPRKSPIAYLQVGILLTVGIERMVHLLNSAQSRTRVTIICFLVR